MSWRDIGCIFRVDRRSPWMASHGYVPTAVALHDRIRVFTAFWDEAAIGRIGWIDVDRDDPAKVLGHAAEPIIALGPPGTFDEHGMTPLSVQRVGDELWMHYAGWQRSPSVRYFLFTGLAISDDDGLTFRRVGNAPVIDRTADHYLMRTGFTLFDQGVWRAWVAESEGLIDVGGKPTPTYRLGYLESADGVSWPATGARCFRAGEDDIFGYGRSTVWRDGSGFRGLFSVRRRSGYRIEYATSDDGIAWTPLTAVGGMAFDPVLTTPRQSETMFPSIVQAGGGRIVMFYNGDDFGREGVRAAVWDD